MDKPNFKILKHHTLISHFTKEQQQKGSFWLTTDYIIKQLPSDSWFLGPRPERQISRMDYGIQKQNQEFLKI